MSQRAQLSVHRGSHFVKVATACYRRDRLGSLGGTLFSDFFSCGSEGEHAAVLCVWIQGNNEAVNKGPIKNNPEPRAGRKKKDNILVTEI